MFKTESWKSSFELETGAIGASLPPSIYDGVVQLMAVGIDTREERPGNGQGNVAVGWRCDSDAPSQLPD